MLWPDFESIKELSKFCFVPLTAGGGMAKINQVDKLLDIGADKVSVNTAAYENPNLIEEIANKFGSQSIVVSIDVRYENNKWSCYSNSGSKNRHINPVKWSKYLESIGAGEILLTSIDRDGTMSGYNHELISLVSREINIPIIASGGAGSFEDMYFAIQFGACFIGIKYFSIYRKTFRIKTFLDKKSVAVKEFLYLIFFIQKMFSNNLCLLISYCSKLVYNFFYIYWFLCLRISLKKINYACWVEILL